MDTPATLTTEPAWSLANDFFQLALWAISGHVSAQLDEMIAAELEFRQLFHQPSPPPPGGDGDGGRDSDARTLAGGDGDGRRDSDARTLAGGDGDGGRDSDARTLAGGDGDGRRDGCAPTRAGGDGDANPLALLADPDFNHRLQHTSFTFTASQILARMRPEAERRGWEYVVTCLTPSSVGRLFTKLGLPRARTNRRRYFTVTIPVLARLLAHHRLDLAAFTAYPNAPHVA